MHYWTAKTGKTGTWNEGDGFPSKVVVDETVVKIGGDHWYLYAAISPEDRRIVYAAAYPSRNYLTTKSFFQKMMKKYGRSLEKLSWTEDPGTRSLRSLG